MTLRNPILAAALAVVACCGGSLDAPTSALQGGSLDSGSLMPPGGGALPVATYYDRNFRTQAASVGTLPTCSAATNCVMQCTAAVSGAWNCVDETGSAITVTAGVGTASYLSPYGYALDDVTDASAPTLEPPPSGINGALGPSVAWTVLITAEAGEAGATSWMGWTHDGTTGDYLWMRNVAAGFQCRAGGIIPSISPGGVYRGVKGGWGMHSCRWDGTNTLTVRSQGDQASATGSYTIAGGTITQYFGSSWLTPYPLRGGLHSVTIFAEEKSDAWMSEAETEFYGGVYATDDDPIANPRPGEQYVLSNGRVEHYANGTGVMDATNGLHLDGGANAAAPVGSGWATDALDASSWTAIGTPTTTVNQAAGPFGEWKAGLGGLEADLIEDNDGAASEGYSGPLQCSDAGTNTGFFTASCYVRSGTTGTVTDQVRVGVVTNGAGSLDCATTGLTSTFQRVSCTTEVTGSPTSTVGRVLVGDDDADTGSIIVSQCQCEPRGHASNPKPLSQTTRPIAEDSWEIATAEVGTWPDGVTDGGDIEVIFKLDYEYPTYAQWTELLMDIDNNGSGAASSDHSFFLTLAYLTNAGDPILKMATHDKVVAGADCHDGGASETDTEWTITTGDVAADTWYVARAVYEPATAAGGFERVTHKLYWDTCADPDTCKATTLRATGVSKCAPNGSMNTAYLGKRIGTNDRRTQGHIGRITVKGTTAGLIPSGFSSGFDSGFGG